MKTRKRRPILWPLLLASLLQGLISFGQTTTNSTFLTNGLTGYYTFDNGITSNGVNGKAGISFGTLPQTNRFGVANRALQFDRSERSFVGLSTNEIPPGNSEFTVSLWLAQSPRTVGGSMNLLFVESRAGINLATGDLQWSLDLPYDWAVRPSVAYAVVNVGSQGFAAFQMNPGETQSLSWTHLTLTTKSNTVCKIYINGKLTDWISSPAIGSVWNMPSGRLFLGSSFTGAVDDLRIYNRALSASEVAALYNFEKSSTADTDRDGIPDYLETSLYHTNPFLADTDGDGFDDGTELRSGSDPLDPNSKPESLSAYRAIELVFGTSVGVNYQMQSTLDLVSWVNIGNQFTGLGGVTNVFVSARTNDRSFFRLKRVQ